MTLFEPRDPFSEVVDERRRWTPDWYSWLRELTQRLFGGQLAFPPTQNPSTDPNVLDDYEEGTWTPVLTFATPGDLSVSYVTQLGAYVKIGRFVLAHFGIVTTSFTHTTASGDVQITGLPFTVEDLDPGAFTLGQRGGALNWQGITKANYTDMVVVGEASTTFMTVRGSGSGQTAVIIGAGDMPSGGTVILRSALSYIATA